MRNPRPFNFFRCKYCLWCFADFSAFKKHVRSHEGIYRKFWSMRGEGLVCKCGYVVQDSGLKTHSTCHYWNSARHVGSKYFAYARQHPHGITSLYRRKQSIPVKKEPVKVTPDARLLKYDKTHSLPKLDCPHCGHGFRNAEKLKKHIKVHTGETGIKCEDCGRNFLSQSGLQYHRMSKHLNSKPHKCDVCGHGFIRSQHLKAHKTTHLKEKPFKCKICHKGYTTSSILKAHERTHLAVKPYQCKYCGREFIQKGHLKDHVLSHGVADKFGKQFNCDVCNRTFHRKKNLRDHYRTHTGEEPHMCEQCGHGFITKNQLVRHEKGHSGQRHISHSHRCDQCDKTFNASNSLQRHVMKKHTGIRPYKCEVCNKGFAFMAELRTHKEVHLPDSEKPLKCQICNRGFNVQYKLNTHMKVHSTDRSYECEYEGCDKSFHTSNRRARHHLTHTGARPYKCPKCEQAFSQLGNLKRHIGRHGGLTPYKCLFCDYRSSEKGNLSRHVKFKHPPEYTDANIEIMLIPVFDEDPKDKRKEQVGRSAAQRELKEKTIIMKSDQDTGPKIYKCTECDKVCSRLGNLTQHLLTHSELRPYKCIFCNFRAKAKRNLKDHVKNKHPTELTDANFAIMSVPVYDEEPSDQLSDTAKEQGVSSIIRSNEKTAIVENGENRSMDISTPGSPKDWPAILGSIEKDEIASVNKGLPEDSMSQSSQSLHRDTDTGAKNYKCASCGRVFSSASNLDQHLRIHSGQKPYRCVFCNFRAAAKNNLKEHVKLMHLHECKDGNLAFMFTPGCGNSNKSVVLVQEKIDNMENLNDKDMKISNGIAMSDCSRSDEALPMSLISVNENQELPLVDTVSPEKELASVDTDSPEDGMSLSRKTHCDTDTGAKSYNKCASCGLVFSRAWNLDQHLRIHSGQKPYRCVFCNFRAAAKNELKQHVKRMHPQECKDGNLAFMFTPGCGNSNKSVVLVQEKMDNMENDRDMEINNGVALTDSSRSDEVLPMSLISVSETQELPPVDTDSPEIMVARIYEITRRKTIQHHTDTSAKSKKYECTTCEKSFSCREILNRHLRAHSGLKPYKCIFCDYRTAEKSNLKRHVKRKHPSELTSVNLGIMLTPVFDEVSNNNRPDSMKETSGSSVVLGEEKTAEMNKDGVGLDGSVQDEGSTGFNVSLESGNESHSTFMPSLNMIDQNSIVSNVATNL